MPRRRELRGVAHNLVYWCLSRNFDYNGYWFIGQLYAYLQSRNIHTISFDVKNNVLISQQLDKEFDQAFKLLINTYESELLSKNLSKDWVKTAIVVFQFNSELVHKWHWWRSDVADPFICTAEITTDLGKVFRFSVGCNVWSHDPQKELKRLIQVAENKRGAPTFEVDVLNHEQHLRCPMTNETSNEKDLISLDYKVGQWGSELRLQMRMQAESGLDQLAIFDSDWYAYARSIEPEIDGILEQIIIQLDLPKAVILELIKYPCSTVQWERERKTIAHRVYV